jgi:glycosyltransferase involved in cell wall biosynthesis
MGLGVSISMNMFRRRFVISKSMRQRVHIAQSLDIGGTESQLAAICEMYSNSNQTNVFFICLTNSGHCGKYIEDLGFRVIEMKSNSVIPNLKLIFDLVKIFKSNHVSQVICHGAEANFHGILAALISRVPKRISEEIGLHERSKKAQVFFAAIFALSSFTIVASNEVLESLEKVRFSRFGRYLVIPPPLRRSYQSISNVKHDASMESMNFLFVGRFEPVKNITSLVTDFVQIAKRETRPCYLYLVGSGSMKQNIASLVTSLGAEAYVRIIPPQLDLSSYYEWCKFYIQNSQSEGFGISAAEALSFGKPIITRPTGFAREFIIHRVNGFVLDNLDTNSLKSHLQSALSLHIEDYTEMSKSAHRTFRAMLPTKSYLESLDEILGDFK